MCEYGLGIAQNYDNALYWYKQAANQGYPAAQNNLRRLQEKLGWMYQNGWGVAQDYSEAFKWYQKSADQNNHEAQASLGLMYYQGRGVSKNLQQALYGCSANIYP